VRTDAVQVGVGMTSVAVASQLPPTARGSMAMQLVETLPLPTGSSIATQSGPTDLGVDTSPEQVAFG
jgi:hypothetical protein